ncbi:MAG: TatD family hydrolase [Candidatus Heimdallarchaeota archaeon]|nr:TatD family hydrolase [Candidatus Heimdallarchaeota archaeon]
MKFHDAHCHISRKSFLKEFDISTSMKEWSKMGLEYVIGVSTKLSDSIKIVEMQNSYKEIIPGIGIHPWSAKKPLTEELKSQFLNLTKLCNVLVIGEIGLDHHFIKDEERYPHQVETFNFFLELAEKNKYPVNIHLKGAEKEGAEILGSYDLPSNCVLIHWYSGPEDVLKEFIDRGYFFSINPSILSGSPHIQVLKEVPYERILTESDGDVKYLINGDKTIGSPGIIPETLKKIGVMKKNTVDEVAYQLQANLRNYLNKL